MGAHHSNLNSTRKAAVVRQLLGRDGSGCFYCGELLTAGDTTIEHLDATRSGNDPSNLVLAHPGCNRQAADLPLDSKMVLRDTLLFTQRDHLPLGLRRLLRRKVQAGYLLGLRQLAIPAVGLGHG